MRKVRLAAVSCLALSAASGCASAPNRGRAASPAPEWVSRGAGAFKDSGGGVFFAVGAVSGVRKASLAEAAADDRGRGELAKLMNDYISLLGKSFLASTSAGDPSKSSEEQHVSSALKNFAKSTLNGVTVVERWTAPDGTVYSRVRLDMKAVQKTLLNSEELSGAMRDFIRANAEKAFDELAAENEPRPNAAADPARSD